MPSVLEVFVSGDWPAGRLGHIRTRREADRGDVLRALTRLNGSAPTSPSTTSAPAKAHRATCGCGPSTTSRSTRASCAASTPPPGPPLVTAIVQMARAMELRTIAEGVETAAQSAPCTPSAAGSARAFCSPRRPAPAVLAYLRTRQRHARLALVDTTAEIPRHDPSVGNTVGGPSRPTPGLGSARAHRPAARSSPTQTRIPAIRRQEQNVYCWNAGLGGGRPCSRAARPGGTRPRRPGSAWTGRQQCYRRSDRDVESPRWCRPAPGGRGAAGCAGRRAAGAGAGAA